MDGSLLLVVVAIDPVNTPVAVPVSVKVTVRLVPVLELRTWTVKVSATVVSFASLMLMRIEPPLRIL